MRRRGCRICGSWWGVPGCRVCEKGTAVCSKCYAHIQWGQWQEGRAFDVRVEHRGADTYPNAFRLNVEVRERATGKTFLRVGQGKYVGNFSPIWIAWKGQRVQLTELLRGEVP